MQYSLDQADWKHLTSQEQVLVTIGLVCGSTLGSDKTASDLTMQKHLCSFEKTAWQYTAFPHPTSWIACGYRINFWALLNLEKTFHL